MRVCIVGQGPSAKGKGAEIDACDFVVRLKCYWRCAARNCGTRLDALVHYGWGPIHEAPAGEYEHWFSQPVQQVESLEVVDGEALSMPKRWQRIKKMSDTAGLRAIRWLPADIWKQLVGYLKRHPSTGFVAMAMAMRLLAPSELVLYGFDSTGVSDEDMLDAMKTPLPRSFLDRKPHDYITEKMAIAQIGHGVWLGRRCATQLTWPNMPEGLAEGIE